MLPHSKIIRALLIASVVALPGTAAEIGFHALPQMSNDYQLTTESELTDARRKEIEDFVVRRGTAGAFPSDRAGAQIFYREFLTSNEVGAVVIVSGRTESSRIYSELIYELLRLRYSVYIYDHRGQGSSGGRLRDTPQRGYVGSFDDYVADLEKFVATRVVPAHHKNLYLLAHSMGGGVASLYLEKSGSQTPFNAVALVTPMHEPLLPLKGIDLTKGICSGVKWIGRFRDQTDYVTGTPEYTVTPFSQNDLTHSKVRYEAVQSVYEKHPKLRVEWPTRAWVGAACLAGESASANSDKITIPLLLLQAGHDTAVRPEAQMKFCAGMGDRCEGWLVEQAYHAIFLEADAYRIPALTKVLRFFEEHPRKKDPLIAKK